jgi:hypothetical protein
MSTETYPHAARPQPVHAETSPLLPVGPAPPPPGSSYPIFNANPPAIVSSTPNADAATAGFHPPHQGPPRHPPFTPPSGVPPQQQPNNGGYAPYTPSPLAGGVSAGPSDMSMSVMGINSTPASPNSFRAISELMMAASSPGTVHQQSFCMTPRNPRQYDNPDMHMSGGSPAAARVRSRPRSSSAAARPQTTPLDLRGVAPVAGGSSHAHAHAKSISADGLNELQPKIEENTSSPPLTRSRRVSLMGPSHDSPPSRASSPTPPDHIDEPSLAMLGEPIRARMDEVLFSFLEKLCSNMDATDSNGERIHQTLMAKKMQRLEETPDYRPFKFRIQAFTNKFIQELMEDGLREPDVPHKMVSHNIVLFSRIDADIHGCL